MRAMTGKSTRGLQPSYYCGTYATYGKNNPTGCRFHRVKHDLLAEIVTKYVQQTSPKVAELLRATEVGDLKAATPLLQAVCDSAQSATGLQLDIMAFVEDRTTDHELRGYLSEGRGFSEVYGILFERMRPSIEAEITEREARLDAMLEQSLGLTGKAKQRAADQMNELGAEIEQLANQLFDLREPWGDLQADLKSRREAFKSAVKALSGGAGGRQKTEALTGVIDRIVCRFRHTGQKSFLDSVEITPIAGDSERFTDGISQGPN
jgi:signal transduction histidine kinase